MKASGQGGSEVANQKGMMDGGGVQKQGSIKNTSQRTCLVRGENASFFERGEKGALEGSVC